MVEFTTASRTYHSNLTLLQFIDLLNRRAMVEVTEGGFVTPWSIARFWEEPADEDD